MGVIKKVHGFIHRFLLFYHWGIFFLAFSDDSGAQVISFICSFFIFYLSIELVWSLRKAPALFGETKKNINVYSVIIIALLCIEFLFSAISIFQADDSDDSAIVASLLFILLWVIIYPVTIYLTQFAFNKAIEHVRIHGYQNHDSEKEQKIAEPYRTILSYAVIVLSIIIFAVAFLAACAYNPNLSWWDVILKYKMPYIFIGACAICYKINNIK